MPEHVSSPTSGKRQIKQPSPRIGVVRYFGQKLVLEVPFRPFGSAHRAARCAIRGQEREPLPMSDTIRTQPIGIRGCARFMGDQDDPVYIEKTAQIELPPGPCRPPCLLRTPLHPPRRPQIPINKRFRPARARTSFDTPAPLGGLYGYVVPYGLHLDLGQRRIGILTIRHEPHVSQRLNVQRIRRIQISAGGRGGIVRGQIELHDRLPVGPYR